MPECAGCSLLRLRINSGIHYSDALDVNFRQCRIVQCVKDDCACYACLVSFMDKTACNFV